MIAEVVQIYKGMNHMAVTAVVFFYSLLHEFRIRDHVIDVVVARNIPVRQITAESFSTPLLIQGSMFSEVVVILVVKIAHRAVNI
ncbi:hypothetical protein D3C86_1986250 [compost metagenome]